MMSCYGVIYDALEELYSDSAFCIILMLSVVLMMLLGGFIQAQRYWRPRVWMRRSPQRFWVLDTFQQRVWKWRNVAPPTLPPAEEWMRECEKIMRMKRNTDSPWRPPSVLVDWLLHVLFTWLLFVVIFFNLFLLWISPRWSVRTCVEFACPCGFPPGTPVSVCSLVNQRYQIVIQISGPLDMHSLSFHPSSSATST